jgi:signal transduction histidine kinase
MKNRLRFLVCGNFHDEIAAAIAAEGWSDVDCASFPTRCGHPPLTWEELRSLVPEDCSQAILLGRACLQGMGEPPPDWPPVRALTLQECFGLAAGDALVAEAIQCGAYLLTPGWLRDWRARLSEMGFAAEGAGEFFREFARELLLLDTGTDPEARTRLAELSAALELPARRLAVGLDHARAWLGREVARWRLEEAQSAARAQERRHARELADQAAAMDFLARLSKSVREAEAIAAIEELFLMLFAPQEWHYLRAENGVEIPEREIPPDLLRQMQGLQGDYAWTASGRGFLLRIARDGQTLGIVAAERLAFPEFRERYLDLARILAGVCGLAVANARAHKKLVETEKMASLGYLVAGVAHEINTPVGVGLVAASSLHERSLRIGARFAERKLTQAELQAYLETCNSATGLIRSNLEKIGRLTDAFRQIAVAGKTPAKCRFRLRECLDEAIHGLAERMAASGIEVHVDCDDTLEIESLPGDWACIFGNLLANSLTHGFKGRERGCIDIAVEASADRLTLDYRDDGIGMDAETLAHAFDPFFTTDLQRGMGLGLHLVYNLATSRLGGGIVCDSRPGKGAHFRLEVPR